MARPARGLGIQDTLALGAATAWCVWVVVATLVAGRPVVMALPYLVPAVIAVAGVAAGRAIGHREDAPWLPWALAFVGMVFVLGWAITPIPGKLPTRYPNANAAVGVQLLAAVGLAWLAQRRRTPPRGPVRPLVAALVAAVGVIAVNNSTAATLLAVPAGLLIAVVVATRRGPWRRLTLSAGAIALGAAALGQVWLARQALWPDAVTSALSHVRKNLWTEALGLWARNPLTGGGAGSFREANSLADDPDLARAHSWVMQVGSEFGFIGLTVFGLVLLAGLVLAARGDRASAAIATLAWVALGVHGVMDHLYEFPAVLFTAAAVLGWASHRSGHRTPTR